DRDRADIDARFDHVSGQRLEIRSLSDAVAQQENGLDFVRGVFQRGVCRVEADINVRASACIQRLDLSADFAPIAGGLDWRYPVESGVERKHAEPVRVP